MKKELLGIALLALASQTVMAGASTNCSGAAGNGATAGTASDGTLFVRVAFTPKCSNNVLLQSDQSATSLWVGSASSKGKNSFKGSTNGGAPVTHAACASSTGCVATDAGNALSAASS